ncbi:MAG: GNAT family N-acetyltransferase [Pseudomonadota bacterium]
MSGVRALAVSDAGACAALHVAGFGEDSWPEAEMARLVGEETVLGLGVDAAAGGGLSGFVLLRVVAGEADVLTLAVAPEDRRKGVARALLVAAGRAVTVADAGRMTLDVAADNGAALSLYAGLGFCEDGRRRGYYRRAGRDRVDALLLSVSVARITGHSTSGISSCGHDAN